MTTPKDIETKRPMESSFSAAQPAIDRDLHNDLKLEINRLIWQYAPEETTLGTADEIALKILNSILKGKYLI